MQLDINGFYTRFAIYHAGDASDALASCPDRVACFDVYELECHPDLPDIVKDRLDILKVQKITINESVNSQDFPEFLRLYQGQLTSQGHACLVPQDLIDNIQRYGFVIRLKFFVKHLPDHDRAVKVIRRIV